MSDNQPDENWVIRLTDQTKSHDEWLAVVRFGYAFLLANQPLFFEIMSREASRIIERKGVSGFVTADALRQIFTELNLELRLK